MFLAYIRLVLKLTPCKVPPQEHFRKIMKLLYIKFCHSYQFQQNKTNIEMELQQFPVKQIRTRLLGSMVLSFTSDQVLLIRLPALPRDFSLVEYISRYGLRVSVFVSFVDDVSCVVLGRDPCTLQIINRGSISNCFNI